MADRTEIPERDNEQPPLQSRYESVGSSKRFHIIFTLFKLLAIGYFDSQPTEKLSYTTLQLYIVCEVIYLIALIQITGPTSPSRIYQYLYVIFGTLGIELLLWMSMSLSMWLVVNTCLLLFALALSSFLMRVSDQQPLQEIVQLLGTV